MLDITLRYKNYRITELLLSKNKKAENISGTFVLEQSMRPPVKKSLLPFNNISHHNAFIYQNTFKIYWNWRGWKQKNKKI